MTPPYNIEEMDRAIDPVVAEFPEASAQRVAQFALERMVGGDEEALDRRTIEAIYAELLVRARDGWACPDEGGY